MEALRKEKNITDMTLGSPIKLILSFAVPLFIGNIFQQIYTTADTAAVGHFLGDSSISAIGATSALYSLMITLASGLNSGYSIVAAQAFGARDYGRIRRSFAWIFILNAVSAILITALSLAFLSPLLRFMNTPDEIFSEAYEYIFILCAGLFATIGYNMFAGLFRAVGNSRTPLYYLILSSVLNVALDVILIPFWGVCGAALATVAAQAVSAVLCGISFFKRYGDLSPRGENFNLSRELLSDLLSTGCAMAMMLCVVNLGSIIFQRANNRLGEEIIAAHSSAHKIFTLFLQPISTLATALSAFVSQNRGAGQYGRIRSTLRSVLIIVSALGVFSCAVVYLSGDIFIRLITGTESDVILSNAVMAMRISLPFFPILGILQCLRTAMQAMGQKWAPVLSSVIELILKSVGAFFLIPALGYFGACITEPLTWVSMLVFLAAAYFGTRKHMYKGTKA